MQDESQRSRKSRVVGPNSDWLGSRLYCIHNGFMFGVFLSLAHFPFAKKRFPALRRRIAEFVDEIGLGVSIPTRRRAYVAAHEDLFPQVLETVKRKSELLGAYTFVGAAATRLATGMEVSESERTETIESMRNILCQCGLEEETMDRFLKSTQADRPTIEQIVSPCLVLLSEAIRQLPRSFTEGTCFIAMPFSAPYEGYYSKLYRPMVRELGLVPCRAWGGLSAEIYIDLLYQLIRCSTTVVADVSGDNPNVIYEVGLSHGMGKKVHLLRRGTKKETISNFHGILVYEYSPRRKGWPAADIGRCLLQPALVNFSRALEESGAPRDPEAFLEWRERHGGLPNPEPKPGDPPFITIHP